MMTKVERTVDILSRGMRPPTGEVPEQTAAVSVLKFRRRLDSGLQGCSPARVVRRAEIIASIAVEPACQFGRRLCKPKAAEVKAVFCAAKTSLGENLAAAFCEVQEGNRVCLLTEQLPSRTYSS